MDRDEAEELTQGLGEVNAGGWRIYASLIRQEVPKVLGLTNEEWVKRIGGTIRLPISERREAAAELSNEGMSQREIAAALGISQKTVDRDLDDESNDSPRSETPRSEPKPESNDSARPPSPPLPRPSEPIELTPEQIAADDDVENTQSVQDAQYLRAFWKALCQAGDITAFDAKRLGNISTDREYKSLTELRDSITRFVNAFEEVRYDNQKIRRIK